MSEQGAAGDEVFIKVSELNVEPGKVTINNPDLAAALEEFVNTDPQDRGNLRPNVIVSW